MKKLLLAMVCALIAWSANATLYVTGASVEGAPADWAPENPLVLEAQDGYYTFAAIGEFTISTKKAGWEAGWKDGAYQLDGNWTTSGNTASAKLKKSYTNIQSPKSGALVTYKVKDDFSTIEASFTNEVVEVYTLHAQILGNKDWDTYAMTKNAEGNWEIEGDFVAGSFGLKLNGSWYGGGGVTLSEANKAYAFDNSKGNSSSSVTGHLTFVWNPTAKTVALNGTVTPGPDEPDPVITDGLKAGQTYYIDATDCTWFFNGSAVIRINDGTNKIECDATNQPILSFVAAKDCAKFDILRCDPNAAITAEAWNSMKDIDATKIGTNNCYKINDSFSSGSFTTYTPEEEPAVLPAWIISRNVNDWAGNAISDVTMAYDEATKLYTATVAAAKLRATDGNGFKIGYNKASNNWNLFWGAPNADKTLANGVAATALQSSDSKNFIIAEDVEGDVTIVFSAENKTVTASWTVNEDPDPVPEPADDTLTVVVPTMDVNGEATVEVKLNAEKAYVSGQWDIEVPAGFSVSNIALNEAVCPDHELLTNTVDGTIKCIAYSAKNTAFNAEAGALFTFTLKATDAAAGTANGAIKGIRFNVAPTEENTNIAYLFDDAEIAITTVKAVKTITATPNAIALSVGGTQAIELTINPEDATDATVTWTITEGEDVITLVDGTVTAIAEGSAVIKVVANDGFGAEATINVTVDGKPVTAIELDATEKTLYAGESFTLVATVTPDDATNTGVNWTSDNEAVATVDENGVVTAIAAGEATITATAKDGSGVSASCTVTVKARISGDADGDDNLTIMDIVIIAKAAIGINTDGMHEENMDLDGDGAYTSTDVTMAVSYLMQLDLQALPAYAEVSTDMLKISTPVYTDKGMMLPIYLQGATQVAGLQFDVVIPNGLVLGEESYVEPAASNSHLMSVSEIAANTYRFIIYSANNFRGNELGYINVLPSQKTMAPGMTENKMDVDLNNVMYSDGVSLKATDNTRTTLELSGIEAVMAANGAASDVYTVSGICVARQADAATVATLPAGIYVVAGKKVVKF